MCHVFELCCELIFPPLKCRRSNTHFPYSCQCLISTITIRFQSCIEIPKHPAFNYILSTHASSNTNIISVDPSFSHAHTIARTTENYDRVNDERIILFPRKTMIFENLLRTGDRSNRQAYTRCWHASVC